MAERNIFLSLLCLLIYLPFSSYGLSTPLEDPLSSQKFNIIYVPSINETLDSLVQSHGNGTLLRLGEDMKCFIPNETKMSFLQQINNNITIWNQLLQDSLSEGLNIIDSTMHSKCLSQGNGFWKYQLCYDSDFLQYHNSPSDTEFVNKLGSYLGISNSSEVTLIFDNEIGYYISEFLEPGDVCDLTGKTREVEVQYVCGLNKDYPALQWVKEVGTCIYEARVMVPGLCSLELFAKNEDKLSATQIVCERSVDKNNDNVSHPYNIEGGIVDIVTDFDPSFLNNEIFLLNPVDINQSLIYLLYTGEITNDDVTDSTLFNKFGNAFNAMIGGKLLKGPNNEIITLDDMLEWWAPVINSDGELLFTVNVKMLSRGKAELHLTSKKDIHLLTKTTNFINFSAQGENEKNIVEQNLPPQAKIEENRANKETKLDFKIDGNKVTLYLKNSKGEVVSVQSIQEAEDHFIFLFDILDENGKPIPMSHEATDELLVDLFEIYDMASIIEQLKHPDTHNDNASNEEGNLNFMTPQVEKRSDIHKTNSEVHQYESEDKDVFDPSRGSEIDPSSETVRSDEVFEDEDKDHHNINKDFSSTEGSVSEIAEEEGQITDNIQAITSLEEEHVTDINRQHNTNELEAEITAEIMDNQNIEYNEATIKQASVYDAYSNDTEKSPTIPAASSLIEDTSDYQPNFTSISEGVVNTARISDKTASSNSFSSVETTTMNDIEQHNSVSDHYDSIITDQFDSQ